MSCRSVDVSLKDTTSKIVMKKDPTKEMTYPSVDKLQKVLAKDVFHYAKDAKKASGRALGTLVEIITFYSLKAWGLERYVAIERPLPEFANPEITHNVEYSLYPSTILKTFEYDRDLPITARKIAKHDVLAGLKLPNEKELKVLSQSYDWLLFLTDEGMAQFVEELLLHPAEELKAVRTAFLTSYTGERGVNQFTKVQIALSADDALQSYFKSRIKMIEDWFNIIAPTGKGLAILKEELDTLKGKNWQEIRA